MKKSLLVPLIRATMKFFIVQILLGAAFTINTLGKEADAQGVLSKNITIEAAGVPLKKVLLQLENQTGVDFVYSSSVIGGNHKISLNASNITLSNALAEVLSPLSIGYKIVKEKVLLFKVDDGNDPVVTGKMLHMLQDTGRVITVTGTVSDSTNKPMAGITVSVENNTKIGTATDVNGRFILDVPENAVLVFSSVGFQTTRIAVEKRNVIDVSIAASSSSALEDVVITAFGKKQRKEAVVGSVTSINAKELKIPSSNLTTALAGRLAGIIGFQSSGEPGADNATFFIRGVTTFGNGSGSPLILIDNIELTTTDLARLQPDDIESFSLLKDASATALYGARGANGVIFVTTKSGKAGAAKLNLRVESALSEPTRRLEIADPVTHMKLYTEAQLTRDPLANLLYNQNKIDHTVAGDNPTVYPATDWFDLMFKKRTNTLRSNLSISGGGDVAQYYVAGTFNTDNGILNVEPRNNFNTNVRLRSYQLRSNINIKLTRTTELVVRLFGTFDDYKGPVDGGTGLFQKALRSSPALFAPYYLPDSANIATQHVLFGNYRAGSSFYMNPYAEMLKGYKESSRSRMLAQFELNQNLSGITQGLNFRSLFSTNRYSYFEVSRAYGPYYYNINSYDKSNDRYSLTWLNENNGGVNVGPPAYEDIQVLSSGFGRGRELSTELYAQANLDYSRVFGDKHSVGATLVGTLQQTLFTTDDFTVQASLPRRNIGLSGRASYSYDTRYFAEFNFGYNGSERFYKDKQFGFFPTIGLAWLVSNENFFGNAQNIFNKLKLRGSYGLVGNDAIGRVTDRFFYLSQVTLNDGERGARFGFDNTYFRPGVSIGRYPNQAITWERSYQTNLAVELGILNKVNIVAEIYRQQRKNILMGREFIPTTMGLAAPIQANVGEAESRGLDITADFTHNFNKAAWLTVRGSFTYARGIFHKVEEPEYEDTYLSSIGQSLSQTWGYIGERLFIDEKDVANSPRQNFGLYQAGDIKFRDVNGDGQITTLDRVPIGFPQNPEITYGFGFSGGFKSFDISVFMQGLARRSFWIDPLATAPFINYQNDAFPNNGFTGENALLSVYADNHWSEENRDIYALWPRLSTTPVFNNAVASTWFMRDGSFLRVKTAELGYTLPQSLLKRYKIANLRIYLSGTNLLTFSNFKLWDPEMGGNGLAYPVQRVFNLGLNINF